jgi:phosphoribosylformylglycinamidine synthase
LDGQALVSPCLGLSNYGKRDNPAFASSEFANIAGPMGPSLSLAIHFKASRLHSILPLTASLDNFIKQNPKSRHPFGSGTFPFEAASFDPIDVHTINILNNDSPAYFVCLAAADGFSYGHIFGAGVGWAQSIMEHKNTRHVKILQAT